jgi:N-succinyldiaminopimelate aminotransferase
MRERTVTISSAGKTFSMTGWKTGWICAPPELIAAVRTVKQFLTYVHGAPFQHAAAAGLRLPDAYFDGLAVEMAEKRDLLSEGLVEAGFDVFAPAGTYFVTVDIRPLGETDGLAFCDPSPSGAAWWRCRRWCSTTTSPPARRSCGSRSASGARCSRTRCNG